MQVWRCLIAAAVAVFPIEVFAQSALQNCASQFIGGDIGNAPTIGSSPPSKPFGSNQHLCYRDDGVSFFAIEYWPEQFAPRWAAYKLDPKNYGADGCRTYPRKKANCYIKEETWTDFESCTEASDPFHSDHMLSGSKLGENDFSNTGHDRGHIAPRQAFSWHVCGTYQTFSMANMSPQRAFLNQNIWQYLEQQVLTWGFDEGPIYVVTGSIFRTFPHASFQVYQNGTFDSAKIYRAGLTFKEAVAQHSIFHAEHPKGHILKPKRSAKPDKIKSQVKDVRMPTGYFKVVYRPAIDGEPAHAIGFLLPHTFENLNIIPNMKSQEAFWSFVSRIDLIESASGIRFPGIPVEMKRRWGDSFFLSKHTGRNIRANTCGRGTPAGVAPNTSREQRLAMCIDRLN